MWEVIDFESRRNPVSSYIRDYEDPNMVTLYTKEDAKRLQELEARIWLVCEDYVWGLMEKLSRWWNIFWDYQRKNLIIPFHYKSHINSLSRKSIEDILCTINNHLLPSLKKSQRPNRKQLLEDCVLLRNFLQEKLKSDFKKM